MPHNLKDIALRKMLNSQLIINNSAKDPIPILVG
jgi:hypothetical protein